MSHHDTPLAAACSAAPTTHRSLGRRQYVGWSAIGLVAVAAVAVMLVPSLAARPSFEADAALAFCATTPTLAQAWPSDRRDHRYSASVPSDNPANVMSSTAYSVGKDEVIEFAVASPRPGTITVHGLHDLQAVQVRGTTVIAFRAIYTGRFPLHFHGADGSHFEIAALEVLPGPRPSRNP